MRETTRSIPCIALLPNTSNKKRLEATLIVKTISQRNFKKSESFIKFSKHLDLKSLEPKDFTLYPSFDNLAIIECTAMALPENPKQMKVLCFQEIILGKKAVPLIVGERNVEEYKVSDEDLSTSS